MAFIKDRALLLKYLFVGMGGRSRTGTGTLLKVFDI
jgi:hypothetical protein